MSLTEDIENKLAYHPSYPMPENYNPIFSGQYFLGVPSRNYNIDFENKFFPNEVTGLVLILTSLI